MVLVLLGVCIVLVIVGVWIARQSFDCEFLGAVLAAIGAIGGIVALISTLVLTGCVIKDAKLDDKIAMYTEENTAIELQIAECVQRYQEYEHGVFTEIAPSDAVAVATIYPDLASDGLVHVQIETYIENNNKIKNLKESKIDAAARKWWLYFGG